MPKKETVVFEYKTVPFKPNRNQIEAALPLLLDQDISRRDAERLAASLYQTMIDVAEPLQFPEKLSPLQEKVLRSFARLAIEKRRSPYLKEIADEIRHPTVSVVEAFKALLRKKYVIKLSDRRRRNRYKINIAPE